MSKITRNPDSLGDEQFDIVVVGGGIYGVCMLLEASRRGLRTLLIERNDFGGATSWNSLRIIHGGLRYLQSLDLGRFRRSVREQAWWLENFPDLVEPLPCLMPLYDQGMRRASILSMALKLNDALASPIRSKVLQAESLPKSRVLSADETVAEFSAVRRDGLKAGAMWYDARMKSPQRLIIELLRWSSAAGGAALNYMEYKDCETGGNEIQAVIAQCRATNREYSFRTKYVINCCGPWANELPGLTEPGECKTIPALEECAVAFNIVVNRKPLSESALAVNSPSANAATYFIVPFGERMMIGTEHLPPQADRFPSEDQQKALLDGINGAIPGLNVDISEIEGVLSGRLPPKTKGSKKPIKSPIITGLGARGIRNAITVVGPKYTTARHIAELALGEAAKHLRFDMNRVSSAMPRPRGNTNRTRLTDVAVAIQDGLVQELQEWMNDESVVYIDDFLVRRNDFDQQTKQTLTRLLAEHFEWIPSAQESQT